jgi:hypothetical protein
LKYNKRYKKVIGCLHCWEWNQIYQQQHQQQEEQGQEVMVVVVRDLQQVGGLPLLLVVGVGLGKLVRIKGVKWGRGGRGSSNPHLLV